MTKEQVFELLNYEFVQCKEEGRDVVGLLRKFEILRETKKYELTDLMNLYTEVDTSSQTPAFTYEEPSSYSEISVFFPTTLKIPRFDFFTQSRDEIFNKFYGTWLGRCAGCLLGKPVEGWSKEKIDVYLQHAKVTDLSCYIPELTTIPAGTDFVPAPKTWYLGNITRMPADDDLNYPVLNLHVLETYGLKFTTKNIGDEWLSHLPFYSVCTAENSAYRNLINGLVPPETGTYLNPYREWIGAQIRADLWGWVNPGNPGKAVEFAYRDAVLSHTKNGIYGELYFAAVISLSFVLDDIEQILRLAVNYIPPKSRFREMVTDVLYWYANTSTWEEARLKLVAKYGFYYAIHTINNAGIVLLALLYGKKDFTRTITLAVMGGLDTDCNGATAGSIIGLIIGANNIPDKWSKPLTDTLELSMAGFAPTKISYLADQTLILAKSI